MEGKKIKSYSLFAVLRPKPGYMPETDLRRSSDVLVFWKTEAKDEGEASERFLYFVISQFRDFTIERLEWADGKDETEIHIA